ncbi:glycosyl transferase [Microbacterium sorbitolivorans]|uniref:Glycosyltransferase family 4 protein n=1 Tax=Microbacterium sorbitolivorans TaxID=1867410 RepID=A0A367XVV6_9MICO|nr:glycosyltransferase [Microbacterium sorbitolivorans]RCK56931.1 glycosyltransferase family 4 protein [Microbacterium sorbitolivorans]GGF49927.1 glycosyl transferase [Microbacterium sorbitolivorans]
MSGLIVHEWLAPAGGSENVFGAIAEAFPDAERWCLWKESDRFDPVNETWLARTPLKGRKALALPFMPAVWRTLPKRNADWVLTSSHLFAHHAQFGGPAAKAPKLVYAHTPARYIWVPELDARGNNLPARLASRMLKPLDKKRAQEPIAIAANSHFIANRIAETWDREAEVIYPNVDVSKFAIEPTLSASDELLLTQLPEQYVLGFSRFVPYKRLDAAIDAGRVSGLPVVLAGGGDDESRLRAYADSVHPGKVRFVLNPPDALLSAILRRATVLVFAPVEDFGIIPVEAMAAGTPVIVNAIGGAVESVIDGVTGAHVHDWDDDAELRDAVARSIRCDANACKQRASQFDSTIFKERLRDFVLKHQ